MAALKYWVWLATRPGLTNALRLALLRQFSSPEELYFADTAATAYLSGLTQQQKQSLADKSLTGAETILQRCAEKNIFLLTMEDALYPARLRNIYDPPILLYGRGRMPLFDDEVAVALVGTRKCTPYGLSCGEELGYDLARQGAIVVSGMAKGIDTACLRGALRAGGFTCAVLAGGVDVIYPQENKRLYEDILATGVLLSENPPQTSCEGWRFPVRNRLMSGLSVGTLVVEGGEGSGALITAAAALEQGRDVFAVPGPIHSPASAGCHKLLRCGEAAIATCAWDVLCEYESRYPHKLRYLQEKAPAVPESVKETPAAEAPAIPSPKRRCINVGASGLTDDQITLLHCLDADMPLLTDDIARRSGLPMRRVLSALTMLEIDGYVNKSGAQSFVRTVDVKDEKTV